MKAHTTFAILFFCLASSLNAQAAQENLLLLTDRGHYISGETIYYSALYRGPEGLGVADWSKILYVELIMPNGTSLMKHKIPLGPLGGEGKIIIPEGISSGSYYLKAYTRWMRNCGPESFCYTSIQVYDSFKESVLPEDSTERISTEPQDMFISTGLYSADFLDCRINRSSFSTREKVKVDLLWELPEIRGNLTISVAKAGLQGKQHYFKSGCPISDRKGAAFLPETKGLSLTGHAVSSIDRSPVSYATIYVSVLGNDREFFCNYSDSSGRFFFSFPGYLDDRDLFVSTFHPEVADMELLIDRDFSNEPVTLPSLPVQLTDSLVKTITEMSVNYQISQQYYPPVVPYIQNDTTPDGLFYGHPTATVYFDDFINLPRLEEYFAELIPQVNIRKSKGVKRFVVLGAHHDLELYPPLVMIDGVAIYNVEAILAVSPRLIDRVEIVTAPYIRGNVTFGGIISLISRNNDLAYIDLPSSGLLVSYQMLDHPLGDSLIAVRTDSRLPDVRNTLYWKSGIDMRSDETSGFSFYTSDLKGNYEILIRGIDKEGKYFSKMVPFRVE